MVERSDEYRAVFHYVPAQSFHGGFCIAYDATGMAEKDVVALHFAYTS